MQISEDYHVHVYFDASAKEIAQKVIGQLSEKFPVAVGHFHDKPVGPHPVGSCQITVALEDFGVLIDWLARNRAGLTVFIHAVTGDVMKDHTAHTIWMGEMMPLNLEILQRFVQSGNKVAPLCSRSICDNQWC